MRVDYTDRFAHATDVVATPEQWARAAFGDATSLGEWVIWRGLLGLRLRPGRSPDTVAGWRIAARDAEEIRLEAASWFLSVDLVVQAAGGEVSATTSVRYDRAVARVVWPALSVVHRALMPGVLSGAVARVGRRR